MKKNKKFAVLLCLIIVLALAACGNSAEEAAAMKDEAAEEKSANELLIDSLEYLLQEERTESDEEPSETAQGQQPESEDEAMQTEVLIYYGNGASDELTTEVSMMEQVTAENLIEALLKHNIVSLGTKVNSFEERENNGVKTLYLDLSKTFHEYLKTMTKEGENIIIYSVAATFLKAYDADEIVITVNGAVLKTDYATYEEPLNYAPEQLMSPEGK